MGAAEGRQDAGASAEQVGGRPDRACRPGAPMDQSTTTASSPGGGRSLHTPPGLRGSGPGHARGRCCCKGRHGHGSSDAATRGDGPSTPSHPALVSMPPHGRRRHQAAACRRTVGLRLSANPILILSPPPRPPNPCQRSARSRPKNAAKNGRPAGRRAHRALRRAGEAHGGPANAGAALGRARRRRWRSPPVCRLLRLCHCSGQAMALAPRKLQASYQVYGAKKEESRIEGQVGATTRCAQTCLHPKPPGAGGLQPRSARCCCPLAYCTQHPAGVHRTMPLAERRVMLVLPPAGRGGEGGGGQGGGSPAAGGGRHPRI